MIGRRPARLVAVAIGALVAALTSAAAQPAPPQTPPQPPVPAPAKAHLPKGATAGDRAELPFFPLQFAWSLPTEVQPAAPIAANAARIIMPFANGNIGFVDLRRGVVALAKEYRTTFAPVIADARVLLTGDGVVDALDGTDGTAVWTAPLGAPAAFAPVARAGWGFVALKNGSIVALRTDTGTAVWRATPGGAVAVPPVVEGDRLYAATGSLVHALGIADGQAAWRTTLDSDITAMTAVAGHVFVGTAGRWLVAIDARKGEIRWRYRIGGAAIGLAVDEDRIVAVMLDQSVRAFKIGSGAQAWRQELSFRPTAGPIVAGRSILVTGFAPALRVLDRRTGANVGTYTVPLPSTGAITLETLASAPVVSPGATPFDDLVVFITQHGWLHAARRTFDQLVTPVTAWPGTPAALPEPPPGWVAPVEPATPAATPPTAAPATTATPPPTTPPTPAAVPPGGTPPRTPPAPPAR